MRQFDAKYKKQNAKQKWATWIACKCIEIRSPSLRPVYLCSKWHFYSYAQPVELLNEEKKLWKIGSMHNPGEYVCNRRSGWTIFTDSMALFALHHQIHPTKQKSTNNIDVNATLALLLCQDVLHVLVCRCDCFFFCEWKVVARRIIVKCLVVLRYYV